ncbi:putative leucine-rich repeat receptor-like serine/threonine-protein kinase At2g24130 isoform X2 [Punica granatum]|uniref:non-specific serine/threonine protein kinase n=1 Tax=Punica granatum TaxID=22663 RepID=A0A6P8CNY6_PUNGR|nr:putative leucine-rich repeat receptor-like serine/threonine-protein kinase At2g24130 isoform X2 [Punica granatum]
MGLPKSIIILFLLHCAQVVVGGRALLRGPHHRHTAHTWQTDRAALLEFKRSITSDPMSVLSNWNDQVHVCNFTKVRCGKKHHRVANLSIMDAGLVGILSPFLSNLTGLRVLQLANNHLFGPIPAELSSLRFLRRLRLDINNLQGPIPGSLFALLSRKRLVFLNSNNLTGPIPPSFFSNCSMFNIVDLSNNSLTGNIPKEIGNCPNLTSINLWNNQFTGALPSSLTNISGLNNLDVEYNHISGELPSEIIGKLPSLGSAHLSYNDMTSHENNTNLDVFFTSLRNCTSLEELELAGMGLGGRLDSVSNLTAHIKNLFLQENRIFGPIPTSLSILSRLVMLNLTSNLLNGSIPPEIGNLPKLQELSLSYNLLTGTIPAALARSHQLTILELSNNHLSGEIPVELGNMGQLFSVILNNNFLSGKIPLTLGNLGQVSKLDLSYNQLTGIIPPEMIMGSISEIRLYLNFSHNALEGSLPMELSKLEKVQEMDFSWNNFSGSIFSQISSCIELRVLNLSHNSLGGHLPDTLSELKNLESLDVSGNQLSGTIPATLSKIQSLTFLDLSFNNFQGRIPQGGIFNSITLKSLIVRRVRVILSSRKTEATMPGSTADMQKPLELVHNFPRITYRELSEATEGFDNRRLIGSGSYGRVYKGDLLDGTQIAVKVLVLQSGNSTKSFNRECQVLKRIRHRNLIRIITACSLPDFKALVLPYMANGSLDGRLYPHSEIDLGSGSSDLSLIQRVNICSDVAEGMAYLHHHSPVKVIHCDLKPSNVLLNDDMTALVSDFGIARLITAVGGTTALVENLGNSTANMLSGSIGYIAPEYGFGANTSTKGDVYSFGILVLEMVTRKRPTDDMFVGGLSLHKWVKSHYHGRVERVIDSSILRALRDQSPEVKKMWEVAIGELIELGILCTQDSPSARPTMLDAADDLDRLKRYLRGDTTATFTSSLGISSSTLGDD